MVRPRGPQPECGTYGQASPHDHRRQGEPPCDLCRDAENEYRRDQDMIARANNPGSRRSGADPYGLAYLSYGLKFERRDWMDQAACKGMPASTFFPNGRGGHSYRQARELCASCPVRAECLEWGLFEKFGMFGGLSPDERAKIVRGRTGRMAE